jgi:hypothetical protein
VIYQTCAGPRVQVDATVTPAPAITANAAPLAMCIGGTTLLDASSTNSGYIYTWSPATIPPGGPYVSASPEVTTLYTVTGTDNSGGPYDGCAEIATVTVTVNPSPSSVAATASIYQVCDAVTPYDLYSTSNSNSFVHSTYVSPTKEGGFDQGDTFLSNGWTELNGTYNNWFVGTAAGVKEGLNAAYVGTGFVATGNAAVNHFYRDVVIPAGYTNIALQFYLKMPVIDGGYDYFEVYTTTPAFTPVVGVEPFDNNVNYLLWYYNTSTIFSGYTLHTINLPATLAGTTVRLVFTYLNDGVAPHAVAAVDNISVTAALNIPATYSWTSIPDGFTSSLQNPVGLTQTSTTSYVVTATNSFGCFATDTTTVSTVTSASIVTNPMYVAKCAGETAKFSVVAAGPGLTYQWRKNYTNIPIVDNPSAGTDTLTLLNISSADADIYDVSVLASCGSAVFSDTASLAVHPTPTAVAASNSPVCEGSVLNLTGTTDIGTVFSWSGPAGFTSSVENPSIASATLTAGGTYSFTATLGGCASTGATEVVVNPLPSALAIVPSAPTIIEGAIQALAASGGNVVSTLLSENFNGAEVPGWTAINNSSGGNPALAAWMLYPSDPLNVQSNDNSNYIASNSDAQGSGGTTSTELITPVINTTGYTNLSLSFWHYFKALSDEGKIEVSTDGGVSWLSPALISYTTTQGTATAWAHAVVDLSAYINQTNLQLRFSYNSSWGWYWCVDNVSITTTLASPITWLPITGLYTDALATTPYLGTDAATVYAKPASTTTYTATATSLASCTRTANVIVTVLNKATVTTDATTSVASTTATSGGTVTSDGGSAVTARGVCYGISLNPSLTDNVLTDPGTGTGHYVSNLTLLSPATLYHVRAYATNSAGTSYGADEVFTTLSGTKTINLSVFLEGLYNNGGLMRKAQDEFGDHFPGTVADQITVELHDASNYATVIYNAGLIDLNMDGTATVSIPSTYSGSYYLTIKHRNSIEITSALPVDLSGGVLDYNFATNLSNTYGDNLKAMGEGIYAIYGGDVDQDTGIGVSDMVLVDNQSAEFGVGYIPEDVDGDGGVGVSDMVIVDNNSANFVSAILP